MTSPERTRVEHFRRMDDGSWRLTIHGPEEEVVLDAVGARFSVERAYRNLPPPPPGAD